MSISSLPFAPNATAGGNGAALTSGAAEAVDSSAFQPLLASLQAAGVQLALPADITPPLPLEATAEPLPAGNGLPLPGMMLPLAAEAEEVARETEADAALTDSSNWPVGLLLSPGEPALRAPGTLAAAEVIRGGDASTGLQGVVAALRRGETTSPPAGVPVTEQLSAEPSETSDDLSSWLAARTAALDKAATDAAARSGIPAQRSTSSAQTPQLTPLAAALGQAQVATGEQPASQLQTGPQLAATMVASEAAARAGELVEQGALDGDPGIEQAVPGSSVRDASSRSTAQPGAAAVVQIPVGKPGWSQAVFDKVMWFSSQQLSSAEIQLSPPELGPMQVRVTTQNEQASVYFSSQHAQVREALDQALPRLRELFENQGLQLSDAGVGEHSFAEQRAAAQQEAGDDNGNAADGHSDEEPAGETLLTGRPSLGLVDAYA